MFDYSPLHNYFSGTLVRRRGKLYRALAQVNTSDPSARGPRPLRTLFLDPLKTQLVLMEASLLVLLLLALLCVSSFHVATPCTLVLFALASLIRQYFLFLNTRATLKRPRRFL